MRVLIDSASGCCNGVGRAISAAERYLQEHDTLYSLGAIVHNDAEIRRLAGLGLKTIGYGSGLSQGLYGTDKGPRGASVHLQARRAVRCEPYRLHMSGRACIAEEDCGKVF